MGNQQVDLAKQGLLQIPEMDRYFVDLEGNIYSTIRCIKPRRMKAHVHYGKSKNPYLRISLGSKHYLVHRVVASVHLGRQLTKDEVVNHKDGNTVNNTLSNLEIVSQHENVQHAVANNLYCSGEQWYRARGMIKKSK